MRRSALVVLLAVSACLIVTPALAEPVPEAAVHSFNEGKDLRKEGKLEAAKAAFEKSIAIRPTIGALLNLGDCHKELKDLVSAWKSYDAASTLARQTSDDRYREALDSTKEVEAKLVMLTLTIIPETLALDGLEIKIDGQAVARESWGRPIPLMPGTHSIVAQAAGRKPWNGTVTSPGAGARSLPVPALDAIGSPAPAPSPEQPAASGSSQKTIGLIVGGVGVVGLAVGSVFGFMAMSDASQQKDDLAKYCGGTHNCPATANGSIADPSGKATISTISFIAGGVLAAGGAVLYFTAPSAPSSNAASTSPVAKRIGLSPVVGPQGAGLSLAGAF